MRPAKTLSVATVNKYLRRVSSLFDWGKRHGLVTLENPFTGIGKKQQRPRHKERDRFTIEDLENIFNPRHLSQKKFKHSYCYWLPWLGLYTGARIEELCQIHLSDIRKENDLWVIDINDDKEKRLKTTASRRVVPVHPKPQSIGFLEYVESRRSKGADRLFLELKKQRDAYSQAASKWFARYRKKCGVEKPFHSFRHTFIDELRQSGADHTKIAALVGHADQSETGGRYGKQYRVEVLYSTLCLLEFKVL